MEKVNETLQNELLRLMILHISKNKYQYRFSHENCFFKVESSLELSDLLKFQEKLHSGCAL